MHTRRLFVVVACLLSLPAGTAGAQPDGADILIRDGTIVATAADYEMDGTMWAAFTLLEDTSLRVHRTTDHGLNWGFLLSLRTAGIADRLGLVVGEGESAFVYLFYLNPAQDGDLQCLRIDRETGAGNIFDVAVGPDTIRDFAVCRDYTGDNYWLYAVATAADANSQRALRFLRSETYGRTWTVTDSSARRREDPHLSAGAGSYIHFASHGADTLEVATNTLYGDPGHWITTWFYLAEEVADPVVAAAFTKPESSATVWCVWSQNYYNSGDWDVKYSYTTQAAHGGWYPPAYLAASTEADEGYPDLRNYTSLGNTYVNASYISEVGPDRTVYRRYASSPTPTGWSDTLRINQGSAGTGSEVRPKLCYTPGGPFSGAGCVFTGAGLNSCWWNGPYPTAIAEPRTPQAAAAILSVRPGIGRGPFHIRTTSPASVSVHDRAGRLIRELALERDGTATWDGLDAGGHNLAGGVYFVRLVAAGRQATAKLVLQR